MPEAQNKDTEAGKEDSYKAAVLKAWSQDQQQPPLGTEEN